MPSRLTYLALSALLGLAAAGCESQPYSAGRRQSPEARREAFPIDYLEYAKIGYRMDWVGYPAVTGSLPIRFFQPYQDVVAVLEQGSTLSILENTTGGRRCAVQLSNPITKFVGIARADDRLVVASDADVFFLNTQTCNLAGRQEIEKIVTTEPLMVGNLIIFGTNVGELLAHLSTSAAGGVKAWGFATGEAIEGNPVLVGSTVGAVNQTGEIVFVDAVNGALVGRNRIYGGVSTNPVADEAAMYIASLDQSVYAFAPSGSMLWRYRTGAPLRTQPTLHSGRLYVGIPGEGLVAFDAASGRPVWKAKDLQGFTVVGVNKGYLVAFNTQDQAAVTLDPARGDIVERIKVPGATMAKTDAFENGNLYVASKSGLIAKFLPR
jgi:outer membrane protein assembly factor BamB